MKISIFAALAVFACAFTFVFKQSADSKPKSVLSFNSPVAPVENLIPISNAEAVIAVSSEDHGLRSDGTPKLIVAIWADGRVVWSKNPIQGGAPYLTGTIDRSKFTAFFNRVETDGYFSTKSLEQSKFGPDSSFTSILLKNKESKLEMGSWHETFESSGKIVCTSTGATRLTGKRLDILSRDKPEYIHYRLAWAELRLMISQLIPTDGKSTSGDIHMDSGAVAWRPQTSK